MDYKTQDAILHEAEKQTNEFIQIVWRADDNGEYTLCAVAFKDGSGRVIDHLTDFAAPAEVLATLKEQNAENEKSERMFANIPQNNGECKFVAANMD